MIQLLGKYRTLRRVFGADSAAPEIFRLFFNPSIHTYPSLKPIPCHSHPYAEIRHILITVHNLRLGITSGLPPRFPNPFFTTDSTQHNLLLRILFSKAQSPAPCIPGHD
jgi:hypothetical protein